MFKLKVKEAVFIILYAIPNAVFSFGILYIINNAISGNIGMFFKNDGFLFVSVVGATYIINIIFQKRLNMYVYKILYKNEKKIFEIILNTLLVKFEKSGMERFYAAVEDIRMFAFLPATVTHSVNSLLMIMLCVGYLFLLSTVSALIVVGILIILCVVYMVVLKAMTQKILELRGLNEKYYSYVDDLVKGFKGFKIDFVKRKNLLKKYLYPNRKKAEGIDRKTNFIFLSVNLISQYGLYFAIGVIIFLLPEIGVLQRIDVIPYVVIILFLAGPINVLINMQSSIAKFSAAHKRINSFFDEFDNVQKTPMSDESGNLNPDFKALEFNDVMFSYNNDLNGSEFQMGPVNLSINRGEVIFIIGGNGSGKSTFINILTGLYNPSYGDILLNGEKQETPNKLHKLVSSVFTDNHIYSHNYDDFEIENNKAYMYLLSVLKMNRVVSDDKDSSARRAFSKGQSKRMSLIFALLENKPILVLDEWAADQDPYFRKYFYDELIPKLKEEGKTIIAVTHDDAYFNQADRIIKFDYGQLVKDVTVENQLAKEGILWSKS